MCSNWPTFPQIFIKGEFIGGSDIIMNMHQVSLHTYYKFRHAELFFFFFFCFSFCSGTTSLITIKYASSWFDSLGLRRVVNWKKSCKMLQPIRSLNSPLIEQRVDFAFWTMKECVIELKTRSTNIWFRMVGIEANRVSICPAAIGFRYLKTILWWQFSARTVKAQISNFSSTQSCSFVYNVIFQLSVETIILSSDRKWELVFWQKVAKKTSKTAVPTANIIISSIFETEIQSINEMFSWAGTRIKGEKSYNQISIDKQQHNIQECL